MNKFRTSPSAQELFKLFCFQDESYGNEQHFSINYYLISWFPVCKRDDWSKRLVIRILDGYWEI